MSRILRFLQQSFLYLLSANERDRENVGSRGDVADKAGAVAGTADVQKRNTTNEGCSSGPIHVTEPGDRKKREPDSGEAVEASDAQEVNEEVHNRNQEQSESLGEIPEGLPSTSQKRRKRRATTQAPGSDTQHERKRTRRARGPNWTIEETQMLIACKSQPSLPKGQQGWEVIADMIPDRNAKQCRLRWDTLQKRNIKNLATTISSGPAASEQNGGSLSSLLVGKPNVPSSASPHLEVSRAAAFSAEQRPCAVDFEQAPFLPPISGMVVQDGLPTTTTAERSHLAMAADDVLDCDDPISFWRRNLLSPDDA